MTLSSRSATRVGRPPRPAAGLHAVGDWQPVRLLDVGSWSHVYQARPRGVGADRPADYAIKRLIATDDQHRRQGLACLQREARVARDVAHANLTAILSAHIDGPPYYLVMPYLEGATLKQLSAAGRRLPLPLSLWIVRQVARALGALHDAGWLHADVKPANIHVSPRGHVTLIDLGLARAVGGAECGRHRPLTGTLQYAAPEMISTAMPIDARCDVYSLGVVLYELITGQLPFAGEDPAQLALAHLQQKPSPSRRFVPQLPLRLGQLVRQLLAKQPLRRPDTGELVVRLAELEIETFDQR